MIEEDHAQGAGETDVEALKADTEYAQVDYFGGFTGAAAGEDLEGIEGFEGLDGPQHGRDGNERHHAGKVMCRNICHGVAPSTIAASRGSPGRD